MSTYPKILSGLKLLHHEKKSVRHCKIVATLGPSSCDPKVLRELIEAGLDVARLNFSHGTHEFHLKNIENIRALAKELDQNVMILQDLQGPKIRCASKLLGDTMAIKAKERYCLVFGHEQTDPKVIPIDYQELVKDVAVGQKVLMDDGLLTFAIEKIEGKTVHVVALESGTLKPRKGVNFPESKLSIPALTEKDSRDLLFGVTNHVDFVALSFVQDPKDILQVKEIVKALGADTPVIAKIEKLAALEVIDEIAQVADGLMVARGDLGVEASIEKVPIFQRRIIEAATRFSKPVIIATQMLESMIENPRATSSEVADVANGVLDGADCLMLSAEVASGRYPVQCVKRMTSIIEQVELWTFKKASRTLLEDNAISRTWETHEGIAIAACEAAMTLDAKAIVCLTLTGSIAKSIAKWRPSAPIIAISPRKDVVQRLAMVWGVYAVQNSFFYNSDVLLHELPDMLKAAGVVQPGDSIVITAGIPLNLMKPTNMIRIKTIT